MSGSGAESASVTLGINSDSIGASELNIIDGNSPTDENCLTYESGGSNGSLEWEPCGSDEVYGSSWNGSTEAPTKNSLWDKIETLAGLIWGTSISGTTADGLTLNLSNSSDDAASALKIVAGNTQTNQPILANLQMGTSTNTNGLLIQGTGSDGAQTGTNHLKIWGNTANNSSTALSIGSEPTYGERFKIDTRGRMTFTPSIATGWTGINMNAAGITGNNTAVLINLGSNMTANNNVIGIVDSGTYGPTATNSYSLGISRTQTATTAINNATIADISYLTNIDSANTRTRSAPVFNVVDIGATNHASANLTLSGPVAQFTRGAAYSSGTLSITGPVVRINGTDSPYFTGNLLEIGSNNNLDSSVFSVDKIGNLTVGGANSTNSIVTIGSDAVPGCIAMGDSDGSGVTYVTANDGVLSASTTAPSNCQ